MSADKGRSSIEFGIIKDLLSLNVKEFPVVKLKLVTAESGGNGTLTSMAVFVLFHTGPIIVPPETITVSTANGPGPELSIRTSDPSIVSVTGVPSTFELSVNIITNGIGPSGSISCCTV